MPEIPIILPQFMQEALEEKERRRQRPYMECIFPEEMSFESFCDIADSARQSIRGRKIQLSIEGPVVRGNVESRSGLSAWYFEIDFNDYGQITGRYWLYSGNDDSVIPEHMANMIREGIREALEAGKKDEAEVVEPEYYCPNCNADLRKQQGFDPANHVWVCKGCGMQLFDELGRDENDAGIANAAEGMLFEHKKRR